MTEGRSEPTSSRTPEIDTEQLAVALSDEAALIDVREANEYVTGHVPGATLLPMTLTENDLYNEVEAIISASDFIEKTAGAQLLFI